MANKTQEELEKILKEQQGLDSVDTAKDQLTAVEQGRPTYTESQRTQDAYQQLQKQEQQRPKGYTPGQTVTQTQQQLLDLQQQKPGDYRSQYQSQIQGILDTINSRPAFNYNAAEDPMYRMYRDQYMRMGNRAAEDAQAQAAALTGGYGSTYGAGVGQQAYQGYLAELNNQVPALMQLAQERYQNEFNNDMSRLSALQGLEEYAYGQYRDKMGDYYTDRDYLTDRYDTEYSKDYQQYRDSVSDYENELAYLYQKYGDMYGQDYERFLTDVDMWMNDREYYLQKYGMSAELNAGSGGGSSGGNSLPELTKEEKQTAMLTGLLTNSAGMNAVAKQAALDKDLQDRTAELKLPMKLRKLQTGGNNAVLSDEDEEEITRYLLKLQNK